MKLKYASIWKNIQNHYGVCISLDKFHQTKYIKKNKNKGIIKSKHLWLSSIQSIQTQTYKHPPRAFTLTLQKKRIRLTGSIVVLKAIRQPNSSKTSRSSLSYQKGESLQVALQFLLIPFKQN
ncbi:hypothetical protein TTHERM_000408983 (macronuclear) [Tetrahymena thermophila SB210]|uniref:Uncharacterized protein n=1 Tax=Tetrahymena thermophila (strain SB210) TaxID=312017 RepID=W7X9V1_TETTS|nr:hypothetical protein TTHERM_000408983 [Tetrahymena thermophila SB210]EWS73188.1 hypothetical protein TTHERM_000408983 [Tetrahymena thermophila SB210]|eukprot:XP_012654264.1 hypothetical protein TTHERM_000408983 [Tetrahymena thermophila SB210]